MKKNVKNNDVKINNDNKKNYGILFCMSFIDFLLIGFYILLSIITISDVSVISAIILLVSLSCSIFFIVMWQLEENKEIEIKTKKNNIKKKEVKTKKTSKIYKVNKTQTKKQFRSKLKEQI